MKNNRNGQAAIFAGNDFQKLIEYTVGENHKLIFQIAYWTAARVGEVVRLPRCAVFTDDGQPLVSITYWSEITKNQETRQVPASLTLEALLERYYLLMQPDQFYLFPGKEKMTHLQFQSADDAMRRAIKLAGLSGRGYSCHSFRRSAITRMNAAGISTRVIQQISGHKSLASLQRYIEVTENQIKGAIATL